MGRTWKHKSKTEDFYDKTFLGENDFLDYFFNENQFIIDRLIEKGVSVSILENGRKIHLKYADKENIYFPLTGTLTYFFLRKTNNQLNIFSKKARRKGNRVPLESKAVLKYLSFADIVAQFIALIRLPIPTELLYECAISENQEVIQEIKPLLLDINEEVIRYLKKHPEFIYSLDSRKFEELIAHIFKHFGFDVELTSPTRDGGKDIIAYLRNEVCSFLTFIECKKYSLDNPVGVNIIRSVYGVQEIYKPDKSIIVTSSYFTKEAIKESKLCSNKLELKDYSDIKIWLNSISS